MPPTLDNLSTIRLDILKDDDEDRLKQFLDKFEVFVVYCEVSEVVQKVHLQGYVSLKGHVYKDVKEEFHKAFAFTHTKDQRSMAKVTKVENYMRYVAKDKNLWLSRGVSPEELKKREDESYKKGEKKVSLYDQLAAEVADHREWLNERTPSQRREAVLRWVIRINHKHGKLSRFQMKAYVDKVLSADQDYEDQMVFEILERW